MREARTGLPRTPRHLPAQLASTIAGATVFYVAALPALVPDMGFDPLRKAPLRAHREAMVEVARLLLGRSA